MFWHLSPEQDERRVDREDLQRIKHILIQIQLRVNLEKTLVTRNYEGEGRKILIKPVETLRR
ncbi:hypothetical protein BYT27DRAFT_6381279 [Phlegmacium glaucopus]|nr:hypothetical protein BYT27DRAFT_6381279 [Phlegmacium glaucopus]